MSNTINLVLPFNDKNVELVKVLLSKADLSKINNIEVVEPEELEDLTKTSPKAPARKPRPSRAKVKSEPEPEDDEDLDDENLDDDDLDGDDEEAITADDLRAKQAEKVVKHRAAIKAQLGKLKATGIKDLDEKHYPAYFDFLSKLK